MKQDIRYYLLELLDGGSAHQPFQKVIKKMPPPLRGVRAKGIPYSPWELLEHMRIAQADILSYCLDPDYEHISWPDDYWPSSADHPSEAAWHEGVSNFQRDLDQLKALVKDTESDLHSTVPSSNEHTLFREILLVADHNAYHLGQMVSLRRLLGHWPPEHDS